MPGLLQMADNTFVILDETAMQPGQLNANGAYSHTPNWSDGLIYVSGVKNLSALSKFVATQTVAYDFEYSHIDFLYNTQALVLSEGKSLLPVCC